MSDSSPFFFMKEFSNDELANLLIGKVKQLKEEKAQSYELNQKLKENLAQLEETTSKLEQTQEELKKQRDGLTEEVKQKTEELLKKKQLSAIGELSARIAHDMRNPLSVIKNTVEILTLEQPSELYEKTKLNWERLDRAIYRITHQVDDVLDFIKVSPLKKSNNTLSEILKDSLDRMEIPDTVTIKLPENDVTIPCDQTRLVVVFVNLIMNAIQAMDKKPGTVTIKIHETDNDFVLIEIKDTGPGISLNIISKIFDPLFTTRQIGTGLGLPSCQNIVEKHGGTIEVKSKVGKWTLFSIRLPKKNMPVDIHNPPDKKRQSRVIRAIQ